MKSDLERALQLEQPYSFRRGPLWGRRSAVLLLIASAEDGERLLLTQRTESLQKHKGQIAFPGGAFDEEDDLKGGLRETALREAEEEVGLDRSHVEILGALPELSTPTGYRILPFVGWTPRSIEELTLHPKSIEETAEVFWVPLQELRKPEVYRREPILGGVFETDAFYTQGKRIWGATAAMIKNLLDRLDRLG